MVKANDKSQQVLLATAGLKDRVLIEVKE